jgi:sigma-B regulation protein RsbU (phosphoserine phosphatase)
VNAGHNPGILLAPGGRTRLIKASGTPLGMLPGSRYTVERATLEPGARLLLYTDGLTEIYRGDEEFGEDRLISAFAASDEAAQNAARAETALSRLWQMLDAFGEGAPQVDDMSAIALCRLG